MQKPPKKGWLFIYYSITYISGGMSSRSSVAVINDVLNIMYRPTPENPRNSTNMQNINTITIALVPVSVRPMR